MVNKTLGGASVGEICKVPFFQHVLTLISSMKVAGLSTKAVCSGGRGRLGRTYLAKSVNNRPPHSWVPIGTEIEIHRYRNTESRREEGDT